MNRTRPNDASQREGLAAAITPPRSVSPQVGHLYGGGTLHNVGPAHLVCRPWSRHHSQLRSCADAATDRPSLLRLAHDRVDYLVPTRAVAANFRTVRGRRRPWVFRRRILTPPRMRSSQMLVRRIVPQREEILRLLAMLRNRYGIHYQPRVRPEQQAAIDILERFQLGKGFEHAFLDVFSRHPFTFLDPLNACITGADRRHGALIQMCNEWHAKAWALTACVKCWSVTLTFQTTSRLAACSPCSRYTVALAANIAVVTT